MNPEAVADTAVLVAAILTLLAIASKLITANLMTRTKRAFAKLDTRRRDIATRLKESQLKRTSARGTLEFWERRRTETSQKVQDAMRDLETYQAQFGEGELDAYDEDDAGAGAGADPEQDAEAFSSDEDGSRGGDEPEAGDQETAGDEPEGGDQDSSVDEPGAEDGEGRAEDGADGDRYPDGSARPVRSSGEGQAARE